MYLLWLLREFYGMMSLLNFATQSPTTSSRLMMEQRKNTMGLLMPHQFNIHTSKSFRNPNFVNNFARCQNMRGATEVMKNSSQTHIIQAIKEKCPELLPLNTENKISLKVRSDMCNKIKYSKKLNKKKPSKQNLKRREVVAAITISEDLKNQSNSSMDNSEILTPSPLILQDFIPLPTKDEDEETTPNKRIRTFSTDTEDSSISFRADESLCRRSSFCESEDSFITFERDDNDSNDETDTDYSTEDESSSDDDNDDCMDIDEVDFIRVDRRKVKFAPDDHLVEVHHMVQWSFAYQAARKGPWEMYARDRSRFHDRSLRIECDIKHVLDPQHRARIFKERFQDM